MVKDSPKPKQKVVLYARFSPRPRAAECESCENQLKELRQYAWKRGYEIVGQFKDEALSGGDDWQDRPGMFDAAEASKRGMLFCVRSFDRLFRDTRKALVFGAMLEGKGVRIRSITEEAASLDTPEAKLMRGFFLLFAEYQREITRARTRTKMLEHQRNGRRMSKEPPYGWRTSRDNPSLLEPDPYEQEVIEIVKSLACDPEMSLRAIGRTLTERGFHRRGKPDWPHQIIKRILRRSGCVCPPRTE